MYIVHGVLGAKLSWFCSPFRCWLFAMLNVARQPFVKQHNIEDFEFSQVMLLKSFFNCQGHLFIRVMMMRSNNPLWFSSQLLCYQGHLFYWDKIERANYFLHNIVVTARRGEEVWFNFNSLNTFLGISSTLFVCFLRYSQESWRRANYEQWTHLQKLKFQHFFVFAGPLWGGALQY